MVWYFKWSRALELLFNNLLQIVHPRFERPMIGLFYQEVRPIGLIWYFQNHSLSSIIWTCGLGMQTCTRISMERLHSLTCMDLKGNRSCALLWNKSTETKSIRTFPKKSISNESSILCQRCSRFLQNIQQIKIPKNTFFVTIEVGSLYANINNKDGLAAVAETFAKTNQKDLNFRLRPNKETMEVSLSLSNQLLRTLSQLLLATSSLQRMNETKTLKIFYASVESGTDNEIHVASRLRIVLG